jgi:N-methylhydantoinase A
MERALRVISVERGYDPVEFVLVAFGGAGGLHVAELAGRLGARRAIVPPDPGLLSAYGMLASPVTREVSRTILVRSDAPDAGDRVTDALEHLERSARQAMASAGADPGALRAEQWIDARYLGQSFELAVPADGWTRRFHEAHQDQYGYAHPESPVEAVTARVLVVAPAPHLPEPRLAAAEGSPPTRSAEVTVSGTTLRADRVRRRDLRAGHRLGGPVIVQEYSGTTWVPPGWQLQVDPSGNLHLGADL